MASVANTATMATPAVHTSQPRISTTAAGVPPVPSTVRGSYQWGGATVAELVECRPLLQMGAQMGRLAGRLGTDHPGCDHQDLQSESWSTSQRGCQWAEVTCQWPY